MNKYVIVDGLPYLLANGVTYPVKWDTNGFTVGAAVEMAAVPARTYSELSVRAKCAGHLDSITQPGATQETADQEREEEKQESTENTEPAPKREKTALDRMTVRELMVYADTFDIDISGLTRKADILSVIKAVMDGCL